MNKDNFVFFSLGEKEKQECKAQGIPEFYYLYKLVKTGELTLPDLKEFIFNRIIGDFSFRQKKMICGKILAALRTMIQTYTQITDHDRTELNKHFLETATNLIGNLVKPKKTKLSKKKRSTNKPSRKKKKQQKTNTQTIPVIKISKNLATTRTIISRIDRNTIRIRITFNSDNSKSDDYCLYLEECDNKAKNLGGKLDCQPCKFQNLQFIEVEE